MKRKKPSACEELAITQGKNPEAVQINSHYGYISIVYFDENLTKIKVVVIYGICTHDRPKGV